VEEPVQPELDFSDLAVQSFGGPSPSAGPGPGPRPATVEDAPDAELAGDAAGVSLPPSPVWAGRSPGSDGGLQLPGVPTHLSEPAHPGYFGPDATETSPTEHSSHFQGTPDLPAPPTGWKPSQQSPTTSAPPTTWSQPPVSPPAGADFYHQPTAPTMRPPPPTFATSPPTTAAVASPPVNPYRMHMPPTANTARPTAPPAAPPVSHAPVRSAAAVADEAAMVGAQKHAKWAISALNFEDVPTAVRELRAALELLGAT
jgi:vacuolar protein sorting-associated protein VTA1